MSGGDPVHALANLKARYCAAADSAATDPEDARVAFRALFAPDVVADYGFGALHGAEAAADFMCDTIPGNSQWMLHMLHSPLIEVAGETASGQWTVMVHSRRRDDGRVEAVIGRYADRFRLTDSGWRIASVTFSQLT